jgi:hypothetical protein
MSLGGNKPKSLIYRLIAKQIYKMKKTKKQQQKNPKAHKVTKFILNKLHFRQMDKTDAITTGITNLILICFSV